MDLHNSMIRPVYSYGARVWSPEKFVLTFENAMRNPMAEEQRAFMRRVVTAKNPNMTCLYREPAQRPMQLHWASLVVRLWNGLVNNES